MNVCARSIASVTEEVAQGRTLSIELTEACLQRINVLNTSVNAVVTLNPKSKKDARRVDGLTSIREG
jgi:Asp-tRNA(Asn)/Glu-tRNA(Gln) amidotransferase A subunit family amidase